MKKRFFLLMIPLLLFISACGSNQLDDFVEDFNQSARKYDTTELMKEEFVKDQEEDEYGQKDEILYQSNEYTIEVVYEKKDIVDYSINDIKYINKDGLNLNSDGYNAALTLADSLDLNINDFEEHIQKGLKNVEKYEENDYDIFMSTVPGHPDSSLGISVLTKD